MIDSALGIHGYCYTRLLLLTTLVDINGDSLPRIRSPIRQRVIFVGVKDRFTRPLVVITATGYKFNRVY